MRNPTEQPARPIRKRRRKMSTAITPTGKETPESSDAENGQPVIFENGSSTASTPPVDVASSALEREVAEQEDEEVRRTNAYPGATNSIHSIHQRQWYMTLDRQSSGFVQRRHQKTGEKVWVRKRQRDGELLGFEPFFVRGVQSERSVVTGRTADEIMEDEGVKGYIRRKGWRAVLE